MRKLIPILFALLVTACATFAEPAPWPAPVEGFTAPAAGEHPRLFFRKADVPALRAKALTPEGQQIVARLKATLGGGDALPAVESPLKAAYERSLRLPEGAWTVSTPMGFGMLYQLTGDQKYADLAYAALERGWAGVRDRDPSSRYSLSSVDMDGQLRAGPIFGFVGMAYDLCYDGWDDAKRAKVRDWLLKGELTSANGKNGTFTVGTAKFTLASMVEKPSHMPASNHWGAIVGGTGLAVLAVQGDPGVDAARVAQWNTKLHENLKRALTDGFGDHGFFSEGQGPSLVGSNSALVPYLQALRNVAGEDWSSPDSPGAWLSLRWVMETTTAPDGTAIYPVRDELFGSAYGTSRWLQMNGLISHGGWFSQGFGTLPKADIPALLWTYNHVAAHDDQHRFDSLNYPHRAALALINWPIDTAEANPDTRLAHTMADKLHGYYVLRSAWKDSTDVIATLYTSRGPAPYGKWPKQNLGIRLIANGVQHAIPWPLTTDDPKVLRWDNAGGAIAFPNGFAMGVFPGAAAGCDAVLVRKGGADRNMGGPVGEVFDQSATIGGTAVAICTISVSGNHPKAVVQGDAVRLGGLLVRLVDGVPAFTTDGEAGLGANPIDAYTAKKIPHPVPLKDADIVLPKDPALAYSFDPSTLVEKDGKFTAVPSVGDPIQTARLRDIKVVPGILGSAIHSGTKGVGIIPPGPGNGIGEKGMSISFWFRLDAPIDGYGLFMENSPGFNGTGKYQIGWHPGPVLNYWGYGAFDVPFGNEAEHWYHYCIVADTPNRQLVGYIDGQPVVRASATDSGTAPQPLYLFGRGKDLERASNTCNNAAMDELRFYKRALTPGEVMALYREGTAAEGAGNQPPVARFTTSAPECLAGKAITFDAAGTVDVDGDDLTYAWDFGDGATATTTKATHTYAKDGNYAVKLTVTDGKGGTGTATQGVRIANRPPVARLTTVSNGKVKVGASEIAFDAGGSTDPDGGVLKVTWQPKPLRVEGTTAIYKAPTTGLLRVTCITTDPDGGSSVAMRLITRPGADGLLPATDAPDTQPGLHVNAGMADKEIGYWPDRKAVDESQIAYQVWTTTPDLDWCRVRLRSTAVAQAWYGYLNVPADGQWTFAAQARQGAVLWIDGNYVVGSGGRFSAGAPAEVTVGLAKGLHRIRALSWAVAAGADPNPYYFASFAWFGPGVERRALAQGDFRRSSSPWELAAAGKPATPGDDVVEAWNVPIPTQVGTVDGIAVVAPGDVQRTVTLAVRAADGSTVEWSTGQGRLASGKEITLVAGPGNYVATAKITDPDGSVRIASVPYEVPASPYGRSIGIRLKPDNWLFSHECMGSPAQRFWNTRTDRDPATQSQVKDGMPLRDSAGTATTCVVKTYLNGGEPAGVPGGELASGIDGVFMGNQVSMGALTLDGIPYVKYEIRVYWAGVNGGQAPSRPITPVAVFHVGTKTVRLQYRWDAGSFVDRYVVLNDGEEGAGNIARFRDLTGPTQTITLDKMPVKRFGVVAIQVVEIL